LIGDEQRMAEALVQQYERAMLLRAEAMVRLKERGRDIALRRSPLDYKIALHHRSPSFTQVDRCARLCAIERLRRSCRGCVDPQPLKGVDATEPGGDHG